jgi:hypothetical protein
MAHKVLENGRVVVDWTTGDPEGDRITVLSAYRDFINEVQKEVERSPIDEGDDDLVNRLIDIFKKWKASTDNQVDEVPRIWIKRPE